ncbi:O-antigen ligase family protein [Seonamhaeicola marinus]|uniref:O-antigen ligase family protein n=1 Tax=Seonamhaeicola marinus TaxID=1912246 RepID=A0A5D0HS04_9FLAO|nr:O-antigen ligase family protein [Seonamhaeicola marinus]TYA74124.1 O-antigen ligase family protein [Seonamhaeicola marinus]
MKNIFKTQEGVVAFTGLLIVVPNKLQWLLILVLGINFFYHVFFRNHRISIRTLAVFSIPFLIFAIGLTHLNPNDLKFLQRALPFFIYSLFLTPFINYKASHKSILREKFFMFFVFSSLAFIVIAYLNFLFNKKEWWGDFYDSETLRNSIRYIPDIELDPIYVSFYFSVALIFTLELYFTKRKVIYLFSAFLFTVFILILSNKMAIFSLLIISILVLLKRIRLKKRFYILILIPFLLFTLNNRRFKELITNDTYSGILNSNNSTSIRLALLKSSLATVPENYLFGCGFAATKQKVSYVFIHRFNGDREYNTHNQFMGILIATGVLGLLLFIYYFWFVLKIANSSKDHVFMYVVIIIIMNLITENMLERQFGVYLISHLVTFLGYLNLAKINEKENIDNRNKLLSRG